MNLSSLLVEMDMRPTRAQMERHFSRMAFLDPPVVPDADGLEFDSVERKTLDYLKDEYYKAVSVDHLFRTWNRVTYEELEESTGFYFTIRTTELVGESLASSNRPRLALASTLLFTKEELVAAVDNPYSVMRGVSRLLGHKTLQFKVDSVQFDINKNGDLTASVSFDKTQLNQIHAGISYNVRQIVFVLVPNASLAELKSIQVPTTFETLTVGFSLQDLSLLVEPNDTLQDPTGEANMRTLINPSPISLRGNRTRVGSILQTGAGLLGSSRRFSTPSSSRRMISRGLKKEEN
jgi:hypothetical protein